MLQNIEALKAEIRTLRAELANYPLYSDRAKIAPRRNEILLAIADKEARLTSLRRETAHQLGRATKRYEINVGQAGGAGSSEVDPDRTENGRPTAKKFG